jgi:predicted GIY-YIG superfamily endonuclease
MPRGKGTVYAGYCSECAARVASLRVKKAKKADFRALEKFCKHCRKKTKLKLKEEKHSS